jgi:hypothetical protein
LGAVLTDGGEHKTRIVILNPPQKSAVSVEAGLLRQKFPNCASEIMEARQLQKYFFATRNRLAFMYSFLCAIRKLIALCLSSSLALHFFPLFFLGPPTC